MLRKEMAVLSTMLVKAILQIIKDAKDKDDAYAKVESLLKTFR